MRTASAILAAALIAASSAPFFFAPARAEREAEAVSPAFGVGRIMPEEKTAEDAAQSADTKEPLISLRPVCDAGGVDYDAEIEAIARTMWGEARGIPSTTEIAAVGWCILNRVDSPDFPNNVIEVCAQPNQFKGYRAYYPVTDELRGLAADVMIRWVKEREGDTDAGRVLPAEYLYFVGNGEHNLYTVEYLGTDIYDWRLPSPYED